ncbi:MAG: tetratricopeptide repeat protein [Saprospiraceae bacterium]|nr:tetratricopeptide repeat protein [Saprospiraceae bacterium]
MQNLFSLILQNTKAHRIILVLFSFVFYGNTLVNDFAVDDSIVIVRNEYTKKGFSGIGDILTKDTFRGFFKVEGKDKLVSGGRYRPLSLVTFAIVFEFFGSNPFIYHLLNIIFLAFAGLVLYEVLKRLLVTLFKNDHAGIAFLSSFIFIIHPVHTECVANIKGLDEILALLLSLTSFLFILKWKEKNNLLFLIVGLISLMLALFSKENSISYLVLIPLGMLLFLKAGISESFKIFLYLLIPTFIFLYCRAQILGWNPIAGQSIELMNNPFLKFMNGRYIPFTGLEKFGTILFTLIKYIGLLLFPHPLTYDYYPRHIELHTLASPISMFSLFLHLGLINLFFKKFKNSPLISFSIAAYIIPLFIVSNLLFSVGTFMGERFLFMPSIGFSILAGYFLLRLMEKKTTLGIVILFILIIGFGFKTITRNRDWKNDLTLILQDVKTSPNSAKINTAVGGILLEKYSKESNQTILKEKVEIAKKHLNKSIEIHPYYFEAYQLLGNAYFLSKDYKTAIEKYNFLMKFQPDNKDATINQALFYKELGRVTGMNENNPAQAVQYLKTSLQLNPNDEEATSLLGVAHGVQGQFSDALEIFNGLLAKNPKSSDAYFNLYLTYLNMGNKSKAEECLSKAKELDPKIMDKFMKGNQ